MHAQPLAMMQSTDSAMIEARIASGWFRKPKRARTRSLSARIAALMRAVRASSTLLLVMLAVLTAFSRCQNDPSLSSAVMTSAARLNAPIERLQPPNDENHRPQQLRQIGRAHV